MSRTQLVGIAAAIFAPLLWSGNFIAGRYISADIGALDLTFWRHLFASFILLILFGRSLVGKTQALLESWRLIAALSITGVMGFNLMTYTSLHYITASHAVLILAAGPLLIVGFSNLLGEEALSIGRIIGMVIGLYGVSLLLGREGLLLQEARMGELLMFGGTVSFAIYSALVKRLPSALPSSAAYTATVVVGTVFLLILEIPSLFENTGAILHDGQSTAAILYIAIGPSVVAYLCWMFAIRRMGAGKVAGFLNLTPLFGVILASILLDETLTGTQGLGGTLILVGIICANCSLRQFKYRFSRG